jgi:hypothetical protein
MEVIMRSSKYWEKTERDRTARALRAIRNDLRKDVINDSFFSQIWPLFAIILLTVIFAVLIITSSNASESPSVDMQKIMMIESGGRNVPSKIKSEHAIGIYQITPIVLAEWNAFHPKKRYAKKDLWNTSVNAEIAYWYLNVRIPQMLRAYKKPVTVKNIIISYNAGISYVAKNKPLPYYTKKYLKKYGVA